MKRLLCLLLLLSIPLLAAADLNITRIDIIASSGTTTSDLAKKIQYAIQNANPGIDANIHKPEGYRNTNAATTLAITIGDGSLPWLNERKSSYAAAIAFHVGSSAFLTRNKMGPQITAIYRDQPLSRQLQLAKFLLPHLKRATVLHSSINAAPLSREAQKQLQIDITAIDINKNSDWLKLASLSLRESDVLLGIDDPAIYNGETIRGILLTTYRQGKSLIGPSRAFVNAGSLASCYTSADQYLQQLMDMIAIVIREHRLPDPQFPENFRIAVNKQVAISLNIPIPDEKTLSAWPQIYSGECSNGC